MRVYPQLPLHPCRPHLKTTRPRPQTEFDRQNSQTMGIACRAKVVSRNAPRSDIQLAIEDPILAILLRANAKYVATASA